MFGLGIAEIIVLGLICGVPVVMGAIALVVVLIVSNKKPSSQDDQLREDDERRN
jgi:hypothetical protein